ncbi:MAG TPA: aminotransferase class IV [Geopsychrobacteraceae bacterium]|nr:aminotransferase class IV [Geopsychrobacteraceae bacterium]
MLVNVNGRFIPCEQASLSINDAGFLYGDTLFETLKARENRILLMHEHLDRLELSARRLNFPCPREQIETALRQMAAGLTASVSRLRLTLSRGSCSGFRLPETEQGWFLLTAVDAKEQTTMDRERGATCVLAPNRRSNPLSHLPQMKRGNHADCLYAADYARQKGAREALFVDEDQQVLEGSSSNIFALCDGKLITPPLGFLILGGVMRQQLFGAATELGVVVVERNLPLKELYEAEEVFLCNSLIELLPIDTIDGRKIKRGTFWRELLQTSQQRIGV